MDTCHWNHPSIPHLVMRSSTCEHVGPQEARAVSHRVIAEVQPRGEVLVMFEDGRVREYQSRVTAGHAIAARARNEANRLGMAVVLTEVEWR